jgi:Protein of unknown function (DUF1073)
LGIPGAGKGASAELSLVLLQPDQLEAAYRSDWTVRKAIEIPAFDSTRMWRAWQAEQDQIEALEETEQRLTSSASLSAPRSRRGSMAAPPLSSGSTATWRTSLTTTPS